MRLPIADADRCSAYRSFRSHAPFDRCGVDERLEARTGLPVGLRSVIEFVGVEVVAAHHRDDLAGLRVQRDHCTLDSRNLRELNFYTPVLFVDFLDRKLSQLAILELIFWLPLTPTHLCCRYGGGEVAKAH